MSLREILTLVAMAIPAGVVVNPLMPTLTTFLDVSPQRRCPAYFDGVHHSQLLIRQRAVMLPTIFSPISTEYTSHFQRWSSHGAAGLPEIGQRIHRTGGGSNGAGRHVHV